MTSCDAKRSSQHLVDEACMQHEQTAHVLDNLLFTHKAGNTVAYQPVCMHLEGSSREIRDKVYSCSASQAMTCSNYHSIQSNANLPMTDNAFCDNSALQSDLLPHVHKHARRTCVMVWSSMLHLCFKDASLSLFFWALPTYNSLSSISLPFRADTAA